MRLAAAVGFVTSLALPLAARAQNPPAAAAGAAGRITGLVTDSASSQPVAGAAVTVIGQTGLGALTAADGRYTVVNVPAGSHQVRAARIGFTPRVQTVAVTAGEAATANFSLTAAAVQLSGVVTVGYGTQERRTVTGAVSSVQSEDITQVTSANPVDALKGRLPGVDITASSFEPGASASIRVRGTRSITASNDPLFVVDGVPIEGDLRNFDQNSIERIEVLKDAASAAVYGSRGANGVIIVTTKKGRAGRTQFNFSSTAGASRVREKIDMMNGEEFANYRRESYRAAGNPACANYMTDPTACDLVALDAKMRAGLAAGVSTDWQDEILQTGVLQNYQLSASGGTENTRFRAGVGYLDQTGITIGQGFDSRTATLNLTHDFGRLNVQLGTQAAQTNRNAGRGVGLWDEALFNPPLGRPRDSTGALIFLPTDDPLRVNPISEADNYAREVQRTNILGTLSGAYEIIPGLKFNVNFGPQWSETNDGFFIGTFTRQNRGIGRPSAALDDSTVFNYTLSNFLSLDREFGEGHRVQGTLLYEVARNRAVYDSASARELPYAHQLWYNLGSGQGYTVQSRLRESALQSYMARVNYTLRDRYTFNLTGRVDGSSVLAPGNKYAFFPAAAVAWQIGDEPFMQGVNLVSDLKLRLSYGRVGNAAVNPYQTQDQLGLGWYSFGASSPQVVGYQPGQLANPNLKWETTNKYNLGVDFGLLRQRVSGSIDAYLENTEDLLLLRALPYTSGFASILQNVGATRNRGLELSVSTINLAGWHGLQWETDLNWSMNRNKIVRLANNAPSDIGSLRWVGQPVEVNYTWRFAGIWQTADSALARQMGFKPGDIRVEDIDGNGRIDGNDRTFIGNHYNFPKWQGSLNNRFRFGNADLSVLATARWGYMVNSAFVLAYTNLAGRFNNVDVNYWTPENPSNQYPRPSTSGIGNYVGSLALQDGSHVRIRDITLGYALPASLLARTGAQGARLFVRAQDPFIWTKFEGWDPEAGISTGNPNFTTSQIDVGGPAYRTFLAGLDLNF